jgi:uncharacterized protein
MWVKMKVSGRKIIKVGLVAGAGVGWWRVRRFARRLILDSMAFRPVQIGEVTPGNYGWDFEEVWFSARDGVKLHGWYIPADQNSNRTVIVCHGHSGNKANDLDYVEFLRAGGYNVFLFDFRCHGRSTCTPEGCGFGHTERYDVHGAVDYLVGRGQDRLAIMGFSMGAAIAIRAAAENPYLRAVISDSAYARLGYSIAGESTRMFKIPFWAARPLGVYGWQVFRGHHRIPARDVHPIDYIGKLAPRPVFITHGGLDYITRVFQAHLLYKAASEPKELWIVDDTDHTQQFVKYPAEYARRVLGFLAKIDWDSQIAPAAPKVTLDGVLVS